VRVASGPSIDLDVVHPPPIPEKGRGSTDVGRLVQAHGAHLPTQLVLETEGIPDDVRGRAMFSRDSSSWSRLECVVRRRLITGSGWNGIQADGKRLRDSAASGLLSSESQTNLFTP